MRRVWTPQLDRQLQRLYPKLGPVGAAARLGMTVVAVKTRANRQGITTGRRFWTEAERERLRQLYPDHTAAECAAKLNRTVKSVRNEVKALQDAGALGRVPAIGRKVCPYPQVLIARVGELVRAGLTDAAIARTISAELTGYDDPRRTVSYIRTRLHLPTNSDAILDAKRQAVKTQQERLGIRNTGELRSLAWKRFARESGWPDGLCVREVQILNLLVANGPMTRVEMCKAMGTRHEGRQSRQLLKSRSHGYSYTSTLIKRGFILAVPRSRGPGHGKAHRLGNVYILTPLALQIREEHERHQREAEIGDAGRCSGADSGSAGSDCRTNEAGGARGGQRRGRGRDPRQAG